jgi:glycerol-3-phosphate dehydrogenase (NAD(P)+)
VIAFLKTQYGEQLNMKVSIFGAGAWGTALAISSARAGNSVTLWSLKGNYSHFDGADMPDNVTITVSMADAVAADVWLIVTPAVFFRETLANARDYYRGQPIVICTKGIEASTHKFMSEIIREELPDCRDYGVLSGPQFAREVVAGILTGSTLAGTIGAIEAGTKALPELYIEASDDVIGAEICGIGKNAVALAAGFASVAVSGENKRALLFTLAWNEVVKVGLAFGAKTETFLGLCGLGDLYLSSTSKTSRNYSAGIAIATQNPVVGTVEGIAALDGLICRSIEKNLDLPVLSDMHKKTENFQI